MNETTDAPSILAPLWKRKWLILLVGLLVGAGTYVYYKRQVHVYQGTTQLFLGSGAEEQAQLNGGGTSRKKSLALNPTNQAALINSNGIREAVHRRLRAMHGNPTARVALHGKAHATAKEKNDFITITAQARTNKAVALLANTTAQTYISRQASSYRRAVAGTIALTRRQLRRIESLQEAPANTTPSTKAGTTTGTTGTTTGTTGTTTGTTTGKSTTTTTPAKSPARVSPSTAVTLQEASLAAKINQLESQLYVTNVKQLEPAKAARAQLLKPKPRKNAIFGFAIGLVLASIVAYVLSRFDRRLRSLAEMEAVFRAPILSALPAVRRPLVSSGGQSVPANALREPIRRLHMGLKLGAANIAGGGPGMRPRSILFVSADPGDGKSTIVANLSLVQRDSGEGVAVIEADFRRPVQARLLGVQSAHGLADVLEGRLPLQAALQHVGPPLPPPGVEPAPAGSVGLATLVESPNRGSLSVLLGDTTVANPPALLSRPEMGELVRSMADDFDSVLVDAPVPLQVSDVLPLLRMVDGIVIVARVGHTSEASAQRLVELLARTSSAPVLGVAANAVPASEMEKYGFSPASQRQRWLRTLTGR
jgi:succinoglycan biosynthesis transport protein ExoP